MADEAPTEDSMAFEETDPPRDVTIERETRSMYEDLKQEEGSPYQGAQLLEIFMNAAAVGSYQGLRKPLEGDRQALFNVNSLADKDRTLIRSIAWRETHDEAIYYDHKRAFQIVMEFANGGIRHLHQTRLGLGDNVSELTADSVMRWRELEDELVDQSLISADE
jgi:hypothetical protein